MANSILGLLMIQNSIEFWAGLGGVVVVCLFFCFGTIVAGRIFIQVYTIVSLNAVLGLNMVENSPQVGYIIRDPVSKVILR